MKLHIYQSDKGDCMLLETRDSRFVLCDGGMRASMRDHVRADLAARTQGRPLDAAYISHIDQDHIAGILLLLEDELEWRIFDHHREQGDDEWPQPDFPRPPRIEGIWHNAFKDQVEKNVGAIEKLLAASIPAMFGSSVPALRLYAEQMQRVATSIPEALMVSRLASPEILKIPVNRIPGEEGPEQLMMVRDGQGSFNVGASKWTIVGPMREELENLRKGWNNWLNSADGDKGVKRVRREILRRMERFGNGAIEAAPFDLGSWNGIPDFEGVSAPNVASLMFLVQEGGKRVLLTGDSQQDIILKGLAETGLLKNDSVHVDVLKVQHHGSENNMSPDFARQVSADHYVFCGNGEHGNPDHRVLDMVIDSRLSNDPSIRALSPKARKRPFTFWFSTSAEMLREDSKERKVFEEREQQVRAAAAASGGRMKLKFNSGVVQTLRV